MLSGARLLLMKLDRGIHNLAAAWIKIQYDHSLANAIARQSSAFTSDA